MMKPIKIDESQRITTDERGNWTYPSLAASGHVEIELPSLLGSPNRTERLHARDFGPTVAGKIEAAMAGNTYLKSGPQQTPVEVLGHYIASARGAKLLDTRTLDYAARLQKEFAAEKADAQQGYYRTMVKPFLDGLKPERRK